MSDILVSLDRIFSRKVLGSILVSTTIGRILKVVVDIVGKTKMDRLTIWIIASIVAILLFASWNWLAEETDNVIT